MTRVLIFICLAVTSFVSQSADHKVSFSAMEVQPFYGKNLPENGVIAAITREAFQRSGYEFEIKFMPWKRALGGAENGQYDGILGLYITEERVKTLSFTEMIYQSKQVFIKKKDSYRKHQPNHDFEQLVIAVQLGTHQLKEAKAQGFNVYQTNTNLNSVELLAKERVDLALMSFEHFRYIQHSDEGQKIDWHELEIINPPFHHYGVYNAFSRKSPHSDEMTKAFNKQLLAMKLDGSYDRILSRFGFSSAP